MVKSIIDEILDSQSWIDYSRNVENNTSIWRSFFPSIKVDDFKINVLEDVETNAYPEIAHVHSRDAQPEQDHGFDFTQSIYEMINVQKEHIVDLYELEKIRKNYSGDALQQKVADLCFNRHGSQLISMINARIDLFIAELLQNGVVDIDENNVRAHIDYLQPSGNRFSWDWADPAKSTPLEDILEAQQAIESNGDVTPDLLILSPEAARQLTKSVNLKKTLLGAQGLSYDIPLSVQKMRNLLRDEYGIDIYVDKGQYKDYEIKSNLTGDGVTEERVVKRFLAPENIIFLPKNTMIGNTAFGPNTLDTELSGADGLQAETSGNIALSSLWDPIRRQQLIRSDANFIITAPGMSSVGSGSVKLS